MFFSVIVPCYNSEHYIDKAINTLSQQTYIDYEVVFVDDCSTDNTYEKLVFMTKNVGFKYQLFRNERNLGPGLSKRIGVNNARGRYILFMDSDDWFEINAFQIIYDKLIQTPSDIVYFDAYRAYDSGKKVLIKNSEVFRKCYKTTDFIAVSKGALPFMCFNAKLWKDVTIPSLYNAEDIAVIPILLSKAKDILVLPIPLYNYLYRLNSVSNKISPNICYSFLKSFEYTYSMMKDKEFGQELEFHGIKTILYGALLNGLRANIKKDIFLDIKRSFSDKFPFWIKNKYLNTLPKAKRIYLLLLYKDMYYCLRIYVLLHRFALNVLKK